MNIKDLTRTTSNNAIYQLQHNNINNEANMPKAYKNQHVEDRVLLGV